MDGRDSKFCKFRYTKLRIFELLRECKNDKSLGRLSEVSKQKIKIKIKD
jgi:hypothetical protein